MNLSLDTMKKFLTSYEQLRKEEKRMVSEGHSEKLFTRGKVYGRLLKVFALRSD